MQFGAIAALAGVPQACVAASTLACVSNHLPKPAEVHYWRGQFQNIASCISTAMHSTAASVLLG